MLEPGPSRNKGMGCPRNLKHLMMDSMRGRKRLCALCALCALCGYPDPPPIAPLGEGLIEMTAVTGDIHGR